MKQYMFLTALFILNLASGCVATIQTNPSNISAMKVSIVKTGIKNGLEESQLNPLTKAPNLNDTLTNIANEDLLNNQQKHDKKYDKKSPDAWYIPFEYNDDIKKFAERNTKWAVTQRGKVAGIIDGIVNMGDSGFKYITARTLPAIDVLKYKNGNCFSYTNLFVAAARSIGLPAIYYDASDKRYALRQEDDKLIYSGHIIAGVKVDNEVIFVDFSKISNSPDFRYKPLSDSDVISLFFNNMGHEAMLENIDSEPYFRTAIEMSYKIRSPWNNLAALYIKQGRLFEAEEILLKTIELDVASFSTYYNLAVLYINKEEWATAEKMLKSAYRYEKTNPQVLYKLSHIYKQQGEYSKSKKALVKAIKWEKDPSVYVSKAKLL